MSEERVNILKDIAIWCAENHKEKFCIFLDISGHVDQVTVQIHSGGWNSAKEIFNGEEYFYGDCFHLKSLEKMYDDMLTFKIEHDIWFSEENLIKQKEINRQKTIKSLERQLKNLNS